MNDTQQQVLRSLKCLICKNTFKQAKYLPCLHSFCSTCLDSLLSPTQPKINCPLCKNECEVPSTGFPSNFIFNNLLELLLEEEPKEKESTTQLKSCIICGEGAITFCTHSNIFLCEDCLVLHNKKMKESNSHSHLTIQETFNSLLKPQQNQTKEKTLPFCPKHENKILDVYCLTCNQPICSGCVIIEHKGHEFEFIEKIIEKERKEIISIDCNKIQPKIKQLKKTLKTIQLTQESLIQKEIEIKHQIDIFISNLHQLIEQRKLNLLDNLHQIISTKHNQLKQQRKDVKHNLDDIYSFSHLLKVASNPYFDDSNNHTNKDGNINYKSDNFTSLHANMKNKIIEKTNKIELLFSQHPQNEKYFQPITNCEGIKFIGDENHICAKTINETGSIFEFNITSLFQVVDIPKKGYVDKPIQFGLKYLNSSFSNAIEFQKRELKISEIEISEESNKQIKQFQMNPHFQLISNENKEIKQEKEKEEKTTTKEYICSFIPTEEGIHKFKLFFKNSPIIYHSFEIMISKYQPSIPSFLFSIGSTIGSQNSQFSYPYGICCDKDGNIFVADRSNHRIQKFTSNGEYLMSFGSHGNQNSQFNYPIGIECDKYNNIWVVDYCNHRIQKFDSNGNYLLKIGGISSGNGDSQFYNPWDITSDNEGNIWIADTYNHRIQKFTCNGQFLMKFGTNGNQDSQFNYPSGITFDKHHNHIWVVENEGHRIQKFDLNGNYLMKFGSEGNNNSQFKNPWNISIDEEGYIWITDSNNNRIQQFDSDGNFIQSFGTPGNANSQFKCPTGICCFGNWMYVVDTDNHRVQKFEISNEKFI